MSKFEPQLSLTTRKARKSRQGVALIFVIAAVMILTVLVTDMRFNGQVRFMGSIHERDEAAALGLAHTGVNLYRLILMADRQMQGNQMIKQMLMGNSLWQMVPAINTGLLRLVFASGGGDIDEEDMEAYSQTGQVSEEVRAESMEAANRFGKRGFLDFEGDFDASVRGEDCRLNLNMFATHAQSQNIQEIAAAQLLYRMMSTEEEQEWLRDRNLDPWDLISNIVDWVDVDNVVASGKGGYEDDFYNRLDSPYLAKNAPFDTIEELRLVEGWQDDVYERYADKLTIYGSQKVNINCADNEVIKAMIQANVPRLLSKDELDRVMEELANYRMVTSFNKTTDACTYFQGAIPDLDKNSFCKNLTTSTKVFTVNSTGIVGDTTVTVTAVLNYDTTTGSKEGKFLYWRIQ